MRYAICGRRKSLVECGASDECKYHWACTPRLHKNQKPTNLEEDDQVRLRTERRVGDNRKTGPSSTRNAELLLAAAAAD
ncbi:hypothetical protein E4U57_003532, partial [Claviceps arundinis]